MKKLLLIGAIVIALLTVSDLQYKSDAGGLLCPVDGCCDACYKKKNGQLRLVSNPQKCLKSENYINFCPPNQPSPQYQGEYCFGMEELNNALRFRIGMYYLGDNYYSLSGTEIGQTQEALSGSAVVIDNSLLMTITVVHTGDDNVSGPYVTSKMGKIKLDKNTLNGNLSMIDAKAYEDGSDHIGDTYFVLNRIPCP